MKAQRKLILTALAVALMVAAVPGAAIAGGTWVGTVVDNTALVSWDAGSIAYTISDTATFWVDELVNVQVTNDVAGTNLAVWPGETARPLAFNVQNAGNSTIEFRVQAVGVGTDFVTNVNLWSDDGDGTFDSSVDTNLTVISYDSLAIGVDTVYTYFIVADVPAVATTANTPDVYDLLVTALSGGSIIATQNSAPFGTLSVESVMADTGGTEATDVDYDGKDSARATYNLSWADLTLTKTFQVIDSDPFNTGNHAIPGATVRYTVHVANSGNAAADSVSITDATPAGTIWGAVQAGYPTTGSVNAGDPVIWSIPSLAGGDSADLVFDVTITGP